MSKGLEALERLAYENACCRCQYYKSNECFNKGECVWKTIEKELKALEIIKRMYRPTEHQLKVPLKTEMITQEEYDLLKEVLL